MYFRVVKRRSLKPEKISYLEVEDWESAFDELKKGKHTYTQSVFIKNISQAEYQRCARPKE